MVGRFILFFIVWLTCATLTLVPGSTTKITESHNQTVQELGGNPIPPVFSEMVSVMASLPDRLVRFLLQLFPGSLLLGFKKVYNDHDSMFTHALIGVIWFISISILKRLLEKFKETISVLKDVASGVLWIYNILLKSLMRALMRQVSKLMEYRYRVLLPEEDKAEKTMYNVSNERSMYHIWRQGKYLIIQLMLPMKEENLEKGEELPWRRFEDHLKDLCLLHYCCEKEDCFR